MTTRVTSFEQLLADANTWPDPEVGSRSQRPTQPTDGNVVGRPAHPTPGIDHDHETTARPGVFLPD